MPGARNQSRDRDKQTGLRDDNTLTTHSAHQATHKRPDVANCSRLTDNMILGFFNLFGLVSSFPLYVSNYCVKLLLGATRTLGMDTSPAGKTSQG
ncbi:hypothetical protein RRG08_043804 [Elysia crispata]|uniref:Uncharacterized protein n=1 Tax=Elysia crispata TaxID=231223 RepID=A0AAE0Z4P5_9GAST|nr:hypothetical protein RRG08_043804 [Elysia crispata]